MRENTDQKNSEYGHFLRSGEKSHGSRRSKNCGAYGISKTVHGCRVYRLSENGKAQKLR